MLKEMVAAFGGKGRDELTNYQGKAAKVLLDIVSASHSY